MGGNGAEARWPGWMEIALEPRAYGALLYQFLSLPLGILGFVWLSTGLSLSLGLAVVGIGVLIGFILLISVRGLALAQAYVACGLTHLGTARTPLVPEGTGFWNRYRVILLDPTTWLAQLYVLLRLPIGIIGFFLCLTLIMASAAVLGAALIPWAAGQVGPDGVAHIQAMGHTLTLEPGDVEWSLVQLSPFARVTTFCAGLLGLLGSLHVALGLTWLDGRLAQALLSRN